MDSTAELAQLSDLTFQSAFFVYVLAMILLAVHYGAAHVRKAEARVAVGGALLEEQAPGDRVPGEQAQGAAPRTFADKCGGMGYALVVTGVGLQVASIVTRGFAAQRFPLGNMYEFTSATLAVSVLAGLVLVRKRAHRPVWLFILVPVVVLTFVNGTVLYAETAPVVPALRSFWLPIHVSMAVIGSGIFLVSGTASLLFLLRVRHPEGGEQPGLLGRVARRLPDAQTLDRIAYRATIVAFPVFGAGVVLGAVWAEAAWGRFWGWDPKETVAFVSWVVYAAYLHARATAGWRDTKAAWINVVGFGTVVFNLFFINMVVSGLHSYAGLN